MGTQSGMTDNELKLISHARVRAHLRELARTCHKMRDRATIMGGRGSPVPIVETPGRRTQPSSFKRVRSLSMRGIDKNACGGSNNQQRWERGREAADAATGERRTAGARPK